MKQKNLLQWGRGFLTAEIERDRGIHPGRPDASMGPRFFDRGDTSGTGAGMCATARASMGPRFFDRGDAQRLLRRVVVLVASMGPRFFDRGDRSKSTAARSHCRRASM